MGLGDLHLKPARARKKLSQSELAERVEILLRAIPANKILWFGPRR